jgi:hypothetical protein
MKHRALYYFSARNANWLALPFWGGMGEAIDCDEKKCVLKRLKTLSFIPPVHLFISNFASY